MPSGRSENVPRRPRREATADFRPRRRHKRGGPLLLGTTLPLSRHAKLAGALEFLPSERSLCAKFLRGGNNPGLFDHAGRKTMRHWITSFRLVDDTDMLR